MKLRLSIALILVLFVFVPIAHAQDQLPAPPEDITLVNLLTWVVSGGCAVVTFWYLNRKPEWFEGLKPSNKQLAASIMSGLLAVLGYLGLMVLGVEPEPLCLVSWFDTLVPVFVFGAGATEMLHQRVRLNGKGAE